MSNFLSRNISTIFIMLGHECNLQCKYCLQHDVVNVAMERQVNPMLYNFIIETAKSQNSMLHVQFYGGEPLVFWDKVKEIVLKIEEMGKPDNLYFTMITNGKLFDEEKVKFVNEHFNGVCISWDGRNSIKTRGYNVFEDNKENIFSLNWFSVSGVMSSYNYIKDYLEDCEKLNKDYVENYNGHTISFNVDDLLDVNLENIDLKSFDYDKVYTQIHELCDEYLNFFQGKSEISVVKKAYIEQKINQVRFALRTNNIKPTRDRCGNGYEVLNVDLQGNLYKCHNTDDKVGTIMDSSFNVMKNVCDMDKVKENSSICDKCPVQILCKNGCPLVGTKAREEFYCTMINVMNYPILELITDMGSEDGCGKE